MSFAGLRGWVFDLDGTLTIHQHDFPGIRSKLGVPPNQLILEYLASLPAAQASAKRTALDAIERDLAGNARPADGARAMLEALTANGHDVGIVTRNTKANALLSLNQIGLSDLVNADHVFGRDDGEPKPSPSVLFHLAAAWQLDISHCVMIGDHLLDLETGRNAGVMTIHVDPTGTFSWPDMSDHCFVSLTEILDHLERHLETNLER